MLFQIMAVTLLLQAFGFALPLVTKWVVDGVLPLRGRDAMNVVCAGAGAVALATGCISYLRAALFLRLERHVDSSLMLGFFEHLLSLPYRFFQQRSSGDLLMRLASNSAIREALASYTTSAILDGGLVVVFLVALVHVSPLFALAASAIALLEIGDWRRQHSVSSASCSDIAAQSASQRSDRVIGRNRNAKARERATSVIGRHCS
jgi:ABC-type bacteriocin/lantibiotic exporter with double-glycine peptidase domain